MSIEDRDWQRERDKKNFERMISSDKLIKYQSKHHLSKKSTEILIIFLIVIIGFLFITFFYF